MTTTEFSNEFDILLDSYRRIKKFDEKEELDSLEFNEYEKSVFLTRAQEQIVIELYSGRNTKSGPFESSEELRSNLRNLIKTSELTECSNLEGLDKRSVFYELPSDVLFIIYESAILSEAGCLSGSTIEAIPVTHDDYHRIIKNPFRGPTEKRVLRVDNGQSTIEVISKYPIDKYLIRYLAKPTPIVLGNFSEVSINGVNTISECTLDPIIHRDILDKAVVLAVSSKIGKSKDNTN